MLGPTHVLIAIHEAERQSDLRRWRLARAAAEAGPSRPVASRIQRMCASLGHWLSARRTAMRTLTRSGPAVGQTDTSTCSC